MAGRKTVDVTITEENRDIGKTFKITEMAALDADDWGLRVLFALAQSGVNIPPEVLAGGMASLAAMQTMGLQALLYVPAEISRPLLKELIRCVKIVEPAITRDLTPTDIEETSTFNLLRGKALSLHLGFSPGVEPSSSTSAPQRSSLSPTPTSPAPSAPSSRPARRL